ncbi:CHC2 zinc finger domain-containing protein [Terrimonas pollutisoli]|uniref:CHC2 zinc finger domain-containing protein n=1 Tax=Terrimonas pollutisoli TaxID=3034147 RepID=UPI0023ED2801|nr:CHC2 zinc finger domain-containing protein [Terrimonas sp. H1YJ31]
MKTQPLLCKQVNQIDLVNYLEKLGYRPQKIRGNDYWYVSPLREEKTPSFKVNRRMNVWYDHGIGKGGTLVDFGKLFYRCSVKELLSRLEDEKAIIVSFHPLGYQPAGEKKKLSNEAGKIHVLSSREITDPILREYLNNRRIPLAIANQFCHEVAFELYGKKHLAIGFKNDNGGYELRNAYFKGSSTPKEPRLIQRNGEKELAVFEGFFSFLSFQTLQQSNKKSAIGLPDIHAASLVLNSLSFFEKSRGLMENYDSIHLFLDLDRMGQQCTQQALQWSDKYHDQSRYYQRFKDLNEYLIKSVSHELKQSRRRGMHL